ncbi:hypothetical protein [Streptomyces sp. NBC_00878]|uniref:hypothetical protein n=1 Tax=Streptomyces sp. NBC_00878 TaxID=2975854 RepID=UPI0022582DAE|nr:hypothetical protein [Streptomyces sp. NBC_00878]MCX4905254.1 hypothetical protein [Streptomyces sp. NBC_00878]
MRLIGKAALLAMAASTLLGANGGAAHANGEPFTTAQDGEQNLDCGDSHELVTVNVARTIRREQTCTEPGSRDADASAVGGTVLGPQFTTAQSGKQNLNCGNSADVLTLNVLSTVEEETTCRIVDSSQDLPGRARGRHAGPVEEPGLGGASAVGGTALGPQFTTAQSGKQNLNCGNSADVLTFNALSTVRRRTNCEAVDRSSGHAFPGAHRRGQATAVNGTAAGPQSTTAQNGKQNLHCGSDSDLIVLTVPQPDEPGLGGLDKSTDCRAVDSSTTWH